MAALDLVRRDSDLSRFDAESLTLGTPRFRLLSEADVLAFPDVESLVDGLLPAHGSALLYGPAGVGKFFLALDLALISPARAEAWHGHTLRPGAEEAGWVLYVAAEGAYGLKRRLRAWREATHYTGPPLAIRFLDVPVRSAAGRSPRAGRDGGCVAAFPRSRARPHRARYALPLHGGGR